MSRKFPKIWKYYFFIGIGLLFIHLIRYFNFYITNVVPVYQGTIDYNFYSNIFLLSRIIIIFASFLLIKFRSIYPVTSTFIAWFMVLILLSHEYNKFLFLPILFFNIISFMSLIFYKFDKYRL